MISVPLPDIHQYVLHDSRLNAGKKKIFFIIVYSVYEDAWRERANLSRHMPEALVPDDRQDARLFRLTLQPPKPGQVASQLKQQKGKINHSTRA